MEKFQIPKGYEPQEVEAELYAQWVEKGLFRGKVDDPAASFTMVIPPPNVTGTLHMGHALNTTLQDILWRHYKMKGRNVLWVPGTDHAGIATQNVVERMLAQEGIRRQELGREKFVEKVWEWRAKYGGLIINQLKRLGASCDWSRERFTMDEGLSRAVREVFVRLYGEGLIYRGDYIINWCPRCHTALSDLEVEHEGLEGGLYHIRYSLVEGEGGVIVATTRPETMLGDTAVAVHPEDPRYQGLAGQMVHLPLTGRTIPIIADPYVDQHFGTGALKITPAHDLNDFEIGRRHEPAEDQGHGSEEGRMNESGRGLPGDGPPGRPAEGAGGLEGPAPAGEGGKVPAQCRPLLSLQDHGRTLSFQTMVCPGRAFGRAGPGGGAKREKPKSFLRIGKKPISSG